MISAFGVEHTEVSKGVVGTLRALPKAAGVARKWQTAPAGHEFAPATWARKASVRSGGKTYGGGLTTGAKHGLAGAGIGATTGGVAGGIQAHNQKRR